MFPRLRSFARALLGRSRFEADMQEELRFHLQARTEDLVRSGLSPAEARRRARLEFGGAARIEEECREARGLRFWDAFMRDLKFAARLLRRDPVFAATAILTLGLCIGANTAVFSVVDAVLLRPLPYPDHERLVQVVTAVTFKGVSGEQTGQTGVVWEAVRDRVASLDAAVMSGLAMDVNLAGAGRVENVRHHRVSAGFFKTLGVTPALGREFTSDEDREGGPPVAVLSFGAWRRMFDADRGVVGRTVMLRGAPHTVVGVMPEGFQPLLPAEVWTPVRAWSGGEGVGLNFNVFGRLKPGRSLAQAEAEAVRAGADILRKMEVPRGAVAHLHLVSLQHGQAGMLRLPLLLLWAAVLAVLVVGCFNVAGLLLARGSVRTHEMATRVALGGGRGALVGQLLTESLLLAGAGGAAGLAIGYAVLSALQRDVADAVGIWQPIHLDGRVMVATLALSVATSLIFGLYPALRSSRVDVRRALADGGCRGVAGASRLWPRRLLVVTQMALGLALVVGAGLLVRTLIALYLQPPGFDATNVLAGQLSLHDARYATAASVTRLYDGALGRIRALPGVESAGAALTLPYERALNLGIRPLDRREAAPRPTSLVYVTPGFFKTLRIAVIKGRDLDQRDRAGAPATAVVNKAFARHFYKDREVIGERIGLETGDEREIVGVVGDVQQQPGWGRNTFGPLGAVPTMYVPVAQMADRALPMIHTWFSPSIVVRGAVPPTTLIASMQREMAAVDPLMPFSGFRRMADIRSASLATRRVGAQLFGGLAILALVLTFVGLYGLVASGVAERLREIGIRLALGASRADALRLVARQGLGILGGGALAALLVPVLQFFVWGVPLFDPWTFGGAALGALALALVASLVPALRALRVDPATVLRAE